MTGPKLKKIKVEGAPNTNKQICGMRPGIDQDKYNPMIRCNLPKGHEGPHNWEKI